MSLSGNARQVWSPAPTRAAVSLPDPLEIPGTNEAANNGPRQEGGSDGNSGEPGLSKDVADASSPLVSPTGSSWDLMNDSPDGSPRGDPPSRESGDGDGGGNDDDWEWDAISMSEMESRASSRCGSPGVRSVSSLAGSENDSSQGVMDPDADAAFPNKLEEARAAVGHADIQGGPHSPGLIDSPGREAGSLAADARMAEAADAMAASAPSVVSAASHTAYRDMRAFEATDVGASWSSVNTSSSVSSAAFVTAPSSTSSDSEAEVDNTPRHSYSDDFGFTSSLDNNNNNNKKVPASPARPTTFCGGDGCGGGGGGDGCEGEEGPLEQLLAALKTTWSAVYEALCHSGVDLHKPVKWVGSVAENPVLVRAVHLTAVRLGRLQMGLKQLDPSVLRMGFAGAVFGLILVRGMSSSGGAASLKVDTAGAMFHGMDVPISHGSLAVDGLHAANIAGGVYSTYYGAHDRAQRRC